MESLSELDEEVRELLQNYKYKKATAYEPCTNKNFKECLIGLSEELSLLNITYTFNPHVDVEKNTLCSESLVKLINSVWILLQCHKNIVEKAERLSEQNHILENSNKHLNDSMFRVKEKLNSEQNETRACVAAAQRISDRSEELYQKLIETRTKLMQITKQKDSMEKNLRNEITRLKLENGKLSDKLQYKMGVYTPCDEVCDSTIVQLKERDRKQKKIIATLQANNQELVREILAMKEEIILGGINNYQGQDEKTIKR